MTTGDSMKGYADLCGILFRFPEDSTSDLCWDDDYEEGIPVMRWLRSKYCAPYRALSVGDTYTDNLRKLKIFGKPDYDIAANYRMICEGPANQLLESLTVGELFLKDDRGDVHQWKADVVGKVAHWKTKRPLKWDKEKEQLRLWRDNRSAVEWYRQLGREHEIKERTGKDIDTFRAECDDRVKYIEDSFVAFFEEDKIHPQPYFNELIYEYDYGDGWKIKITCLKRYIRKTPTDFCKGDYLLVSIFTREDQLKKYMYFDGATQVPEELRSVLARLDTDGKPLCVYADGLNVVEDVGGVSGYAEFLKTLNGNDKEAAAANRKWARSLGWTGRMSKPENML